MADTKISALPASTTPLAGTEVMPIVQSGATKQVSVANLTAGRAISATEVTLSTGNLVIGTSGKGIDFSATAGTGTSELLADYEEGTWTPTQGAGLVVVGTFSSEGNYTKVGRLVTIRGVVNGSTSIACSAGGALVAGGLPFTVANVGGGTAANGALNGGSVLYVITSPIYTITAIGASGSIQFFASYYV
jgi:hypothetical protein